MAGCGQPPDPCLVLGQPTPLQVQVAAADPEVEVEKELSDGTECVVVGNGWVDEARIAHDNGDR